MSTAQKYLFETCFDRDASPPVVEDEKIEIEAPPAVSEADIAAAHARGFVEGRNEGIAEMQSGIDQRQGAILEAMLTGLQALDDARARSEDRIERRMLSLAGAIVRKTVPPIARDHAQDTIEQIIRECLPKLMDEPRIVLRVHASTLEELRGKINTLATKSGFRGDIILLSDDELAEADCRVEWADGGAEKSEEKIWAAIDAAVASHLGPPPDEDPPGDAPHQPAAEVAVLDEENTNG